MFRVAAYCRVSTDKEDQKNSMEGQKQYFCRYIQENPDWVLTEIYADEGITGTSIRKRHSFRRMIEDAGRGKFDLLLTKEISRFARNTLDSIYYTRELKALGIGVIFLNDNINTLEQDAELRLTILSSIAQEESRKTSERVKWGQKRRMEQGVVFGRDLLGYDVRGGKLYINEEGAKIVRSIFHKFAEEGKGTCVIARELEEEGIPGRKAGKHWSSGVILKVLRNEKYAGDLIQKKTYTPNYLNHEKKYNHGEEEFVMLKNHHEPIISHEVYDRVQEELRRRACLPEQKSKYTNRYCFSGKIKCGNCRSSYVSRVRKTRDNSRYREWRCYENVKYGKRGCNSCSIKDEDLKALLREIIKEIPLDRQDLINHFMAVVSKVQREGQDKENRGPQVTTRLAGLREKKKGLIELYLSKEINREEFRSLNRKYEEAIRNLEEELKNLRTEEWNQETDNNEKTDNSLSEAITVFLWDILAGALWNDAFYRSLIDRVIIRDKERMEICLGSVSVTIKVSR